MTTYIPWEKLKGHARDHPREFWGGLGITIVVMVVIHLGAERFGYDFDLAVGLVLLMALPFLIKSDRKWKQKKAEADRMR